jgi:predicted MFS family arabinose efflux permease
LCFGLTAILIVAPLMWLGASAVEKAGAHRHVVNQQLLPAERSFLSSSVFWYLAIGFGLIAVVQGVTLHHLLPILNERELHPDVAVMAISFIGPMQVAGRLTMIAAERRVSIHGIAVACFLLIGLSALVLIGAGMTPALLIAFVILFGGAYGVVSIIRPVIARNLLGERQFGAKSGALALVYLAGSASAPFLGALVWGRGGYDLVLPGLVVLAIIGLLLYTLAHRAVQKKQQE